MAPLTTKSGFSEMIVEPFRMSRVALSPMPLLGIDVMLYQGPFEESLSEDVADAIIIWVGCPSYPVV